MGSKLVVTKLASIQSLRLVDNSGRGVAKGILLETGLPYLVLAGVLWSSLKSNAQRGSRH